MATNILKPAEVIDQMIDLRTQLADLENQINALKPAFFAACAEQDDNQFELERAIIARRITPGKWLYPNHIKDQEQQIKDLKKEFQKTHEPAGGREIIWTVKLLTDNA